MLGEGLRAGLTHMGIPLRTVCYLEREAYAAAVLAARIEEGSLDPAPVWSDLLTFDARAWRGAVDGIVAGFPCQDLSLAGKRAGLDGKRSGLFFDILDIAEACGAWFLFLENVAGIASATASVVDEAEGSLDERAAARVLGELADRGWDAEWITLSASDVGASHGRERWFCFAWKVENTEGIGRSERPHGARSHDPRSEPTGGADHGGNASADVEYATSEGQQERGQRGQRELSAEVGAGLHHRPELSSMQLADPTQHGRHEGRTESAGQQWRSDAAQCGCAVADTECVGGERRREPGDVACPGCDAQGEGDQRQRSRPAADGGCCAMADTCGPGLEGGGYSREQARREEPHGHAGLEGRGIFAPGPADPAWAGILQQWPELAPALEPDFRGMVDGMAYAMDESRAQRLKCVGNGVVALCAAAAFVVLARRAGLVSQNTTQQQRIAT